MARIAKPFPYSIEQLEAVFTLDRENGVLIRRVPTRGRKRGAIPPKGNYRRVKLNGELYFEHRVIWMMQHRQHIPEEFEIDHISRDHYDNRPANLRLAQHRQNIVNREVPVGRSGYRGVTHSRNNKFRASIECNEKRHNLGTFGTAEEAAAAYDRAAVRLNAEFALTNAILGLLPTVPIPAAPALPAIAQVPVPVAAAAPTSPSCSSVSAIALPCIDPVLAT